ncbi:MAG: heparinase II/III family protein [Lachnospiraceae bacterium]|nr:heparinase II/III family protein [Lachnospiraceae bacterium]
MKNFRERYKQQIKGLAEELRREKLPVLTEELFSLFEKEGNRLNYEEVYFRRRKFLAVYGMAAYIFGKPEDVAKLEEIILEICEEECWALPAHVNRGLEHWRETVDLFAAETAQALAEIITLVNEGTAAGKPGQKQMSEQICQRVREEVERRVFLPFERTKYGWECSDHNWNAVCCGSIGSAAMYLMAGKEEERLERMLKRICHSLTFYLGGFREDGACMEGIGYFTYGMTYFTGFAEQLLRYSQGSIHLFASEKVRRIAEFQQKTYFRCGQTVSFSDGEKQAKFRMGLICFLAEQYNTVRIPAKEFACDFETDSCYRFMGLMRDYLWTTGTENRITDKERKGMTETVQARHDILPEAQWSICESRNGAGFAIKGGDNGEPHNHNDIGSFLYLAGGEQLICDLGAGEYTKDYFGPGRYGILCNSSEGHSVPVLGGTYQREGKQYRTSSFAADGRGTTVLEFAGAYTEGVVKKLVRKTEFSLENGSLGVADYFELPEEQFPGDYVTEQLVTQGDVIWLREPEQEIRMVIQGEQAACRIEFPMAAEHLRVLEKEHSNHEGKKEIVRLIRWDVPVKQGNNCRYAETEVLLTICE